MAKFSFSTVTFGDIFVRQSQNNARLGFEVQFQSVKRRLDIELNREKEIYNNMDTTLEPVLAGLKRERKVAETEKNKLDSYLEIAKRNINKVNDIIENMVPALNSAASDVGGTAAADFDFMRNQLNKALQNLQSNGYLEAGVLDRAQRARAGSNPSGIGDYTSYGSLVDRAAAVGVLVTTGTDGFQVNSALSTGYAEKLGLLRYNLIQDFDLIKAKQQQAVDKLKDVDAQIEKKDAQERLVVLRKVQTLESRHENTLRSLSLNFEFQQANIESMADRTSFLRPAKGSIMNLFI